MTKTFDEWNIFKKNIESEKGLIFASVRDIWWCSLGINIGTETDGKNKNFERAILVVRVYNKDSILIVPITTKIKKDRFHFCIQVRNSNKVGPNCIEAYIKLTQFRVISPKRLLRKVDVISESVFKEIKDRLKSFI
jgi:mRNA interferase MazF